MKTEISNICYLCGKDNPENRDHFPPKILLNKGNFKSTQRITLPTHVSCNNSFSEDEENFRNYIAIKSYSNEYATEMISKTNRSLKRKNIDTAKFQSYFNSINFENQSIKRVVLKVFKGLFYYDLGVLIDFENIVAFEVHSSTYEHEVKNLTVNSNNFWRQICLSKIVWDLKDENLLIERKYIKILNADNSDLIGYAGFGIHDLYYGAYFNIPSPSKINEDNLTIINESQH